jgi:hypothetical protein
MSLYCISCSNPVPSGRNQCGVCNNGFVSQLACANCSCLVERGKASCSRCPGSRGASEDYYQPPQQSRGLVRPSIWGNEMEVRRDGAGQFGAISDVRIPDDVQYFLGDLVANARSLLELANKLVHFAPTDNTRACIRDCRSLAIKLQEEYETRRGRG